MVGSLCVIELPKVFLMHFVFIILLKIMCEFFCALVKHLRSIVHNLGIDGLEVELVESLFAFEEQINCYCVYN